ncbi:BRCA2 and CDKN1A-interacting protein [Zootoca vivipara]|uniref:BRCA2 and CDKN1A-interacting protein n=1 Tax=Zootoca vivipara TaxID=8524 RepID=UPI0015916DE8|nr:BRCA2 and CDKN1A-interacting protein [Zootoca vivipara]
MAAQAKRRRAAGPPECREEDGGGGDTEDDSSEEPGSEEDSDDDDEELNQEVNIEFEAHSISDNDKNGIKKLLQQLFLKAPVSTADLTDILIQQNHIGSVIKQAELLEESDDDDEDDPDEVFGFISLLNLTERKGTECAEQIKELVLSQCEKNCEQSMVEQLDKLLSDTTKPVGFLLSERFINVPPQIALPMHQQLQKELIEAQKTNKPCGKCYFYLLISKTFTNKKSNVRKKGSSNHQKEELMFSNAEEEFFYEKSLLKFSYSVEEESDSCLGGRWSFEDVPMKPLRTVMVIPADRMNGIMDKLKEYLSV